MALSVTAMAAFSTFRFLPTVTSEAEARRSKKEAPFSKVSVKSVSMKRWAFREGGTFFSARTLRMALTAAMIRPNSRSSSAKFRDSSYAGNFAIMMVSQSLGMACQISSVMKGMKGCSSFKVFAIT